MKRVAVIGLTALAMLNLPAFPAEADPPDSVLLPTVTAAADYLGGLGTYGRLGQSLPLTSLVPGGGDGIALQALYADLATRASTASDLNDLKSKLTYHVDGTASMPTIDVIATLVAPGALDQVNGLRLQVHAVRTVEAPLAITDTAKKVALASGSPGVPLVLDWTSDSTVKKDGATGATWIDANPVMKLTTAVAPTPFADPATKARVGVAEVSVTPASTLTLTSTLTALIDDDGAAPGDGRLYFMEPTSAPGVLIPGELTLPLTDNVTVSRTGTAAAGLGLTTALYKAGTDPGAVVTVASAPLTDATFVPAVTTNAGYDALKVFTNVGGSDLLGGLGQLTAALSAVQRHQSVDLKLPFLDGTFADTAPIAEQLGTFVVAHTRADDPATAANEFGQANFDTVDQMFALMKTEITALQDDELLPSYDPTSANKELTFRLHLIRAAPASPVDLTVSPYKNADGTSNPIGRPNIGNALRATSGATPTALTGLSVLSDTAASYTSGAKATTSYAVDVLAGVSLRDEVTCASPCDTDPADGYTQTTDLPPFLRWFVRTGGDDAEPEITVDTAISSPVATTTVGRAGFAEVRESAPGQVDVTKGTDATKPSIAVQIKPTGSGDANLRLKDLLSSLNGATSPNVSTVRSIGSKVALHLSVPDGLGGNALPNVADVVVEQGDATAAPAVADVKTLATDKGASYLKALDYDLANLDALAGRYLGVLDGVMETAQSVNDALSGDVLGVPLPTLGKTPAALFEGYKKVRASIDAVRNDTNAVPSLQAMNARLQGFLNGYGTTGFSLQDVDGVLNVVSRIHLTTPAAAAPFEIPLNLHTSTFDVAGLSSGGTLKVGVDASGDLAIPIALTTADPVLRLLDSSRFRLKIDIQNGNPSPSLKANLAGISAQLGPGIIKGGFTVDGFLDGVSDANKGTGPIDRASEHVVALTDLPSKLKAKISSNGAQTCQLADPDGGGPKPAAQPVSGAYLCAALPVFLNGNPIYNGDEGDLDHTNVLRISVGADGSGSPTAPAVTFPAGFDPAYLLLTALDFGPLDDGLTKIAQLIGGGLDALSFNGKLPLVGQDLKNAAKAVEGVSKLSDLIDYQTLLKNNIPTSGPTVGNVRNDVLPKIRDAIVATGVVLDTAWDADSVPSAGDVLVLLDCSDADGLQECTATDDGDSIDKIYGVQIQAVLGQGSFAAGGGTNDCAGVDCSVQKPINLGLPALNMRTDGGVAPVKLNGAWELELGFGFDKAKGFYLMDNPTRRDGSADASDTEPEFRAGLHAQLGSGFSADVKLAFLDLKMSDTGVLGSDSGTAQQGEVKDTDASNHASEVGITGGINIQKPGGSAGNDWIAGADFENLLSNLSDSFKVKVDALVNVDLNLSVDAAGLTKGLPRLSTDLMVEWAPSYTGGTAGAGLKTDGLNVAFNNVRVDLGSILKNTIGKELADVARYTEPLKPIREFLFSPIPVVSDLSEEFGGPTITFFDLLKKQQEDPHSLDFIEDVNRLLGILDQFGSLTDSDPSFVLGSFGIPAAKAVGAPQIGSAAAALVQIKELGSKVNPAVAKVVDGVTQFAGAMDDVLTYAKAHVPAVADAFEFADGDTTPDFTFPLFDDPTCIFGMLLGSQCVIAQWSPDDLSAGFHLDVNFGPFFGVLYVTLSGFAEVQAYLTVGYDTKGLMALVNGAGLASLFDGFFLGDLDPKTGADRPEIVVKGGIAAGGKLSVIIAEAGVKGGLEATLNADLRDGGPTRNKATIDGVIRIDEIGEAIRQNILCLFDFSGYLEAFLTVYATFGVCPFCYTEDYDLARVKLLDFSDLNTECNPEPPKLATDMPDGSLRLNVGEGGSRHASDRVTTTGVTKEDYSLTQRADGSVAVTALGFTEEHKAPNKVTFDFGSDADTLSVKGSQANPGDSFDGSVNPAGAWTIKLEGTMGDGDDNASAGNADDTINGEGGKDRIELKGGNDTSDGGAADDQLYGGTGNDTLTGGPGNDGLDGGLGADYLYGGDNDDRLLGGHDTPAQNGASAVLDGGDHAYGGPGKDFFDLGSGDDFAYGDGTTEGDGDGDAGDVDEIRLGPGNDKAWAGQGGSGDACGDILRGDAGEDELHGQGGPDCMYGEAGNDQLFGANGNDRGEGGDGNDRIDGNAGTDTLLGGNGNDTISGNSEADSIFGGPNDDDISGGLGTDTIDGEAGADWIAGDDSSVSYPGGLRTLNVPDDQATGDKDTVNGGADADRIRGEGGDDTIDAGTGDDDVAGNAGKDTVRGNDGKDTIRGNVGTDSLYGGPADDLVIGDADSDLVVGDGGDDRIVGGSASLTNVSDAGDFVYGGVGNDIALGDNGTIAVDKTITLAPSGAPAGTFGADQLTGDDGDDVLYGQDGDDFAFGGNGADRAFGGLGADYLDGQNDADFLVGDQGVVTSTGPGVNPGGAPKLVAVLTAPSAGGIDTILGGTGDDHLYGGAANDLMAGGLGDDYLEGNEGADTADGLEAAPSPATLALAIVVGDDDDIIGGSSSTSDTRAIRPDVGETLLRGGPGGDVVAGDNANITRTVSPTDATKWVVDFAQLAAKRTVQLLDTEKTVAQLTAVSGPDTIRTGLGNDIAFGEGGDDIVDGEDGNDVLVGNQGHEVISGGTGQDDLVGGSMADAGVSSTGRPDVNDELSGGPDEDVLVGDNANVVRTITTSAWAPDPLGAGYGNARVVTLYDLQRPAAKVDPVAGSDLLLGEGAHDSIYGQAENDTAKGGPGDDAVYGGQGSDLVEGNDGEDDLVGGSYVADEPDGGDRVQGGGGADVLMGDNGIVDRGPLPAGVTADRVTATVGVLTSRKIRFLDISGKPDTSGRDLVAGGEGADIGFGQDKDDQVLGGTGQDQLEGMGGADIVLGDSTTSIIAPEAVAEIAARGGILPLPAPLPQGESAEPLLSGAGGVADQDDVIGGTAKAAALDSGDLLVGEGGADFLLGDNGTLARTVVGGAYTTFTAYDGAVQRKASRFDVNGAATLSGPDVILGGTGNDRAWGQDKDDLMYGGAGNDDLLGELGADRVFGEAGEDALVGDRGSVLDTEIRDSSRQITASLNGPTKDTYVGLRQGTLDRRVSLTNDLDGSALAAPGTTFGGNDYLLGGDDHDVIHAGAGDDLANGEYGGDWLFGDLGRDVMWGGRGAKTGDPNQRGVNDSLVDYLFGGGSGDGDASTADILDVRPRPGDPTSWFEATQTLDTDVDNNQHHHGIDWIYGGSGRDVMQADVGQNGPDDGDRLRDWNGNYNLFLHCHASYGGDQDVRQHSPAVQQFLYTMAYGSGAGLTPTEVSTDGTSGDYELALETKGQNGKPMDGSPGHFDQPSCQP